MLARANRLVRAADYRTTVRRGRRLSTPAVLVYALPRDDVAGVHFGFIVSKAVGNAVVRNRVRRRLKAICFGLAPALVDRNRGLDVVIRAHPPAATAEWSELSADVTRLVSKLAPALEGTVTR